MENLCCKLTIYVKFPHTHTQYTRSSFCDNGFMRRKGEESNEYSNCGGNNETKI